MAEQNNLTISDVVTLLAIEGGVSLRARADFEQAKALGAEAVCPVCHKHELSRAPGIDDEPKDS